MRPLNSHAGSYEVLAACSRQRQPAWAACLAVLLSCIGAAHACTSIIVGGGATVDGSIYIARTDDTGDARSTVNRLVHHPARSAPAIFRSNANGLVVTLPAPGLAYTSLPVTLADARAGRNASGETAGINSALVAVSATESLVNAAVALAADPYNSGAGVSEDALPSLLLPQAASARHAVELLGGWVEELGAAEGFGVLLADPGEAWYLETAAGHHWLAQRVPHGSFFVAANQGRFQEVELGDAASVLHSPGLLEFAVSAGLWRPSAGPFNFFRAFMSHGPRDARSNLPRVCALQWRLGGRACQCAAADQPPAFLAPPPLPPFLGPGRRLLGLPDVAGGLREHYSGSAHDPYRSSGSTPGPGAWRPVALLRTSAGHVARLRADPALPHGLRGSNYVAMGMPLLAPFIPIYAGLPGGALPRQLARAGPQPDARSLLWAARRLQALVFQDLAALLPGAAAAIQAWEADVEARQRPGMERRYIAAAAGGNETAAADILAGFTADLAAQASQLLRRLTRQAAQALGLPAVPPDDELLRLLDAAADAYSFRPTDDRPVQQA